MEKMMRLQGEELDLKQLARSFRKGPVRVEEGEEYYFLLLGSEGQRGDAEVLDAGTKALALMTATMMARDSKFRPPTIHGITKKNADGSLSHIVNLACRMEVRVAMFADLTVLGPDGNVVENDSPTEGEVALALAANNEHFARALLIYGSLEQNWRNLYKVLDAMREGNGDLAGLRAKNFVPAKNIENFKQTANSWNAIDLAARHGTTNNGIPEPKMTLEEAKEMFRKLFQGWIKELKDGGIS